MDEHYKRIELKPFVFPPFCNQDGELYLEETNLVEAARNIGTPLIAVSENRIRKNYRRIYNAFKSRYPDFSIRYAIKAYPNLAIISIIRGEGGGADVSTVEEIKMAQLAGVSNELITYTPNNASAEDLATAVKIGVNINFDDIAQLNLVKTSLPETVSFRVNPGIGGGEFKGIVTAGPRTKFGIPTGVVDAAYKTAMDLGATKFGMQMMAGSNVLDWKHFDNISKAFFEMAGEVSRKLGIQFSYLDLGGGFGVPYRPEQTPLDIEKAAGIIVDNLKEACSKYGMKEPKLLIEPGRYIVSDSAVLIGRVNNIKAYDGTFVGTDIGMNILMRPALYGAYHHIVVANRLNDDLNFSADVVGQICESTDKIGVDIKLSNPQIDDYIGVFNAGAYVSSMSSNYNGHLRPAEILVGDEGYDVIREREGFKNLVAGMKVPDRLGNS